MPRRFTDHDLAQFRRAHGEPDLPVPPKPRKSPRAEESRIQCALINYWALKHREFGLPNFALFSIPNGHLRTAITGAILKREGLRSGAPDLMLAAPVGIYHGAFIELKTETGKPSPEQKEFLRFLGDARYAATVAYGYDDAVRFIECYLRGEKFA